MLSKDLDGLMFVTKGIFYIPGVYIITLSVNNEIVCVLTSIIHYSDAVQITHGTSCVQWAWG